MRRASSSSRRPAILGVEGVGQADGDVLTRHPATGHGGSLLLAGGHDLADTIGDEDLPVLSPLSPVVPLTASVRACLAQRNTLVRVQSWSTPARRSWTRVIAVFDRPSLR